jgi:alkylhydroperoxidase family enzyme
MKDARVAEETEQRIYALNAWRETPVFSDRRAALECRNVSAESGVKSRCQSG